MHVGQLNKFLVDCHNEYIVGMVNDFNVYKVQVRQSK